MQTRTFIVTMALIVLGTVALAQDKPAGKVHGYVFGDYFYKLGGNAVETSPSQYSKVEKDFQAFQFRRLYLYYDHNISEKFFVQFLLEGNDKALEPGGRHGVFVKTAYLEWKDFVPMGSLSFGLVPTPTWSLLSEKVWNYRSIEKTIMDYRGLGNASDIGVMMRGKFDNEGKFNYIAMVGNGNGQKPENNKYKKYYASLSAKPTKEIVIEGYLDYEPAAAEKSKTSLKGFAAYQGEKFTVGLEVFQQTQSKAGVPAPGQQPPDKVPFGISLFGWATFSDDLNAYGRFDYYNPDTENSQIGFKENFLVFGLDYMPVKNVHIMPNFWINTFSDKSSANVSKDSDFVTRMTFFYVYK